MIGFGQSLRFVTTCLALLAFVAVGYLLGQGQRPLPALENTAFGSSLPKGLFDNASRGKSLSMATGSIEPGVDALFALDHLTGTLYCFILNSRGGLGATFIRPAKLDLDLRAEEEADFVMTTGLMDFAGNLAGAARLANTVVYIGDGNSGRVVAYGVAYNRQGAGNLEKMSIMSIRDPNALRDQGN